MNRWGDKPYHSLDFEMKKRFGEKVYKIALAGGMTCPNRDGTVGWGGCIFCSGNGSGDFAAPPADSVTEQIDRGYFCPQTGGRSIYRLFPIFYKYICSRACSPAVVRGSHPASERSDAVDRDKAGLSAR